MYIPGRRRTGSSPSRTVMSFAVYVGSADALADALAIEKALQIPDLRAATSVSERAVGPRVCEARGGGARDQIAYLLCLDSRTDPLGLRPLLGRRLRRDRFCRFRVGFVAFGK